MSDLNIASDNSKICITAQKTEKMRRLTNRSTSCVQVSIRDNEKVLEVMRWNTIELEARAHLANIDSYQSDGSCGQVILNMRKLKAPISEAKSLSGTHLP